MTPDHFGLSVFIGAVSKYLMFHLHKPGNGQPGDWKVARRCLLICVKSGSGGRVAENALPLTAAAPSGLPRRQTRRQP
jgi:hypothetical protein